MREAVPQRGAMRARRVVSSGAAGAAAFGVRARDSWRVCLRGVIARALPQGGRRASLCYAPPSVPLIVPRPILATIDMRALRHNLARAREEARGRFLWAVVKANAYGHGLERAVRAFGDADGLA